MPSLYSIVRRLAFALCPDYQRNERGEIMTDISDSDKQESISNQPDTLSEAEGSWSAIDDSTQYQLSGFLQMCIERRFHQAVQNSFQQNTGLKETDYWINADVGGSPRMEYQAQAADYCYKKGVKHMGWSAHGSNCGGFRSGESNAYILEALRKTLRNKVGEYPGVEHHGFFAIEGERPGEVKVLHIRP